MSDFESSSATGGDLEMQQMLKAEMQKAQINSQVRTQSGFYFSVVFVALFDWLAFVFRLDP